jgi:Protein of Unknown function (DUF2784)
MLYRIAADGVVLLHLAFIVFVMIGGLAVLRWRRLAWLHVPAVLWGMLVEFTGWLCPLTPLENRLRAAGGDAGYAGSFVDQYIVPIIYPAGLTRGMQIALGVIIVAINAAVYAVLLRRRLRNRAEEES